MLHFVDKYERLDGDGHDFFIPIDMAINILEQDWSAIHT